MSDLKTPDPEGDASSANGDVAAPTNASLEKRVLRKLDLRLAPMFAVLYFVSYLDRSNIGNAAVAGLKEDLGLSGSQFSTAVSVFFATYVAFEIPAVLAMKKLRPHRAITFAVVAWGSITVGTAFVKDFAQLVVVRVLLGAFESGFFPCLSLYITMVYRREEQGKRLAYLFASVALAGMVGGLIATGITTIERTAGLNSWSWLYIIEGIITVSCAAWVYFGLPDNPTRAKFWKPDERRLMEQRELSREQYLGSNKFDWAEVGRAFSDPKVYACALIQFFQDIILYGFSTFLPSILMLDLGYTSQEAQYLSVPVHFLGGVVFISFAFLGDRWMLRGTLLGFLDIFAVIGYVLLLTVETSAVKYLACYLIAIPIYCGPGLNEIWINNNMAPHYRRATAIGFQQSIGNIAGVVAPQLYHTAPYRLGHWCSLGSAIIAMVLIFGQVLYLRRANRKKEQIQRGEREDDRKETTGEGELAFRYVY